MSEVQLVIRGVEDLQGLEAQLEQWDLLEQGDLRDLEAQLGFKAPGVQLEQEVQQVQWVLQVSGDLQGLHGSLPEEDGQFPGEAMGTSYSPIHESTGDPSDWRVSSVHIEACNQYGG